MPSRTAAGVAQVDVRATLDGQNVETTLFYHRAGTITEAQLETLTTDLADVVDETWIHVLPPTWIGKEIHAFDMTAAIGAQFTNGGINGQAGVVTGSPLPNNATIAIARKNGLRGRSGNGRVFWPGLAEGGLSAPNLVNAGFSEGIVAALVAMDTAATADGWTPVILSFQHAGVTSLAATVYDLAEWVAVDLVVDSRRRRLPGRGS